jgi:hypothetical protein
MEKYFWEQQDWLDKVKNTNMDFYNHIKNGKNIEMDWNSFSLIIDGVGHDLKLGDDKQEIKVIDENGDEKIFIR